MNVQFTPQQIPSTRRVSWHTLTMEKKLSSQERQQSEQGKPLTLRLRLSFLSCYREGEHPSPNGVVTKIRLDKNPGQHLENCVILCKILILVLNFSPFKIIPIYLAL